MDRYVPICENRDFRRLYARGKSYVTPLVVIYVRRMRGQDIRLGSTPSKKIGNAVQRNRSRRVIREAFRALQQEIRPGTEMVLVALGRTPFAKSTAVEKVLRSELKKAGVLEGKNT